MFIRPNSIWSQFLERVVEDRDLFFFTLATVAALLSFIQRFIGDFVWEIVLACLTLMFYSFGVVFYLRRHLRTARQLSSIKHIPVVCVVGKRNFTEARRTFEQAKEAIGKTTGFSDFTGVEKFFKINYQRTLVYQGAPLPEETPREWEELIDTVQRQVDEFADALPGSKLYHIFIQGPASLALGLGAIFGWKHPVIVYQWAAGEYKPVLDLRGNPRRIKDLVEQGHRFIKVPRDAFDGLTEDTAVVLGMAGHPPWGEVENYLRNVLKVDWKIIAVENTYGGTLGEEDWVPVVQELYSVFYKLHKNPNVRRIHLFHSMPVALAFGLGMSLGTFMPVTVYNWKAAESTYYPVLKLNELKSWM